VKIENKILKLVAGLQAEDYYAVAADRRFRAVERHRLRRSGRTGMLIIILVAALGGLVLSVVHAGELAPILSLNLALGLTAAVAYWLLGGPGRHDPELIIFCVALAVIAASVGLGLGVPVLGVLASGYLLLIPLVVSQVVTWRTATHSIWLLVYVIATMTFLVLAPLADLNEGEKVDLAALVLITTVASFCGHVIGILSRIRGFRQLRTIQQLHRSIERQADQLARALADLERTSRVDPLTRVANRLRLDEDFEQVRAQLNRSRATCGLLEADLDRFKDVNDRLGHLAGDEVLRSVAQALQGALRSGDHLYRYGGEEFVAIIAGADVAATKAAAERLRRAVESLAIAHPGSQPGVVTVSIGGTVIGPADIDATDGALFDRADRAMYAAKTNGRNRTAFEPPAWLRPGTATAMAPVAADGTA
jgi:diguanylate cyclase (GGDEF)-like protein